MQYITYIFSPGESGSGSSLARCVVRVVAVGGERAGGRRGDSRRAWPSPESSESTLTSTKQQSYSTITTTHYTLCTGIPIWVEISNNRVMVTKGITLES